MCFAGPSCDYNSSMMKRTISPFFWLLASLFALSATTLYSQSGQYYEPEDKDRYTRSDLDEEQRVVDAYLNTANADIDRAVSRVQANLTKTARISLLRARNFLSLAETILNGAPARIEQLARSIFYNEEVERQKFRDRHQELRDKFYYLEEQTLSIGRELDAKTGSSDTSRALQLISAVTKALPNIRSDATKAELEAILNRLSSALESNNEAAVNRVLGELEEFIEQKGEEIPVNLDDLPAATPSTPSTPAPAPQPQQPASPTRPSPGADTGGPAIRSFTDPATGDKVTVSERTQQLASGDTQNISRETREHSDGSKTEVVTTETVRPDGSKTVETVTTKVNPDGTREVTTVIAEYDAAGNKVGERILVSGANGRQQEMVIDAQNGTIEMIGQDGTVRSFPYPGEVSVVELDYIGGEGFRLTGERERVWEVRPDPENPLVEVDGRERNWDFEISDSPENREFTLDDVSTTFVFRDALGKTNYQIQSWEVRDPSGNVVAEAGAQNELPIRFTQGGAYTVIVNGTTTGWAQSPFTIREQIAIDF